MNNRFRILLVDDDLINIQFMTSSLKDEYDVLTAENGHDAISQIKEHEPDLILLDVMMPDLSGFEVCRIIKSDKAFADIPVIFLTAVDTFEGALQGLELGGIDYLTKPVNYDLLKLRVRNHIALKERNELVMQQRDLLARKEEELRRSQHELEAEKTRYFNLYDLAPIGYLTISGKDLIQEANLAAANMLRLSRRTLLKQPISRFIFLEDQSIFDQHRKQCFETSASQVCVMRMVRADGSAFWVDLQATPAHNGEYWITLIDITKRKQDEENLQKALHDLQIHQEELEYQNEELRRIQFELDSVRARYFDLYDLAPIGYLTLNEQGFFLEANLAAASMLGVVRNDLLRKSISRFIFPEDQDVYYLHRNKVFELHEVLAWEMRLVRADGSIFLASLRTIPAQNGEYWITFIDITEQKQAEVALLQSEEKFRALFESSKDGIVILSFQGVNVLFNKAYIRMHGYGPQEMYQIELKDLDTPETFRLMPERMRRLSAGEPLTFEVEHYHKEGHIFPMEVSASLISIGDEKYILGFNRDITERRRVEAELQQAKAAAEAANSAKSLFLATMSHEIRTPLSAMLGNVELLEGTPLTPSQQECLKDCKSASQMLLQVINDVLDYSKIEAGKLELVNDNFSISSMSRQLVRMFSASAKQGGLKLTISLADDLPEYISCDQQRLRQIITNLLSNAIKFTRQGSVSLEITREKKDKALLRIVVTDTGIGIPHDKLDHIFNSFTQVEHFSTRTTTGTGLGLPICRRLLALMGGSITVSSVPGEGAVFTVLLPVLLCQAETAVQAEVQAEIHAQAEAHPRNILLADDEKFGRSVTQKLLQLKGYKVTAVENGAELLDALQKDEFEILLTDISMPDMDGTQVARIIRSGERVGIDPGIPIIAMTAHAFPEDRERFLSAGINGYVAKPINLEDLYRQIEELCGKEWDAGEQGK